MSQRSFSELEFDTKKRKTRREQFLEKLEILIPWRKLEAPIARYYAKAGSQGGRPPYPLSTMLRVHLMQLVYNLSDPAMEDALYEIESMRRFAGLRLERIPDETTILNFRHLLERLGLGKKLFRQINRHLQENGLLLREGSIVDATIIAAPSSTKNREGERDPQMRQVKKGNEWHFGMKMHIGVDDALGLIHSVETTSANEHDITVADKLLHGEERRVWGDAGYVGIDKRTEHEGRETDWLIGLRPGHRRVLEAGSELAEAERIKASVRAKVEHAFFYIKRMFGYSKVRYRGLEKNTNRLYVLSGLANLLRSQKYLLA
jgi:transposase, IS5 family